MINRPTFFIKRGDRLIARLKHLFYAWRFAEQVNGRVVMIWPPLPSFWHKYDGTDYSPSLIFNIREFYEGGGGDDLVFLEGPIGYPQHRRSLRDAEFDSMRPSGFDKAFFLNQSHTFHEVDAIVFSFKDEPRTREYMDNSLRSLYRRLPHDPLFTRALQSAKDRIGAQQYVALHVRRGDVDEMLRAELPGLANNSLTPARLALLMAHFVGRTAPDEFYYPDIEAAINSGQKIVYFSDTPETLKHFTEKFGRGNFVNAESFKARFPIQKAFLDFNLLAGATSIISTASNYATFAAIIGNCEMINVVSAGPTECYEERAYSHFLRDVELSPNAAAALRNEIQRQHRQRIKAWTQDTSSLPAPD
jgi:hypothetical protein